MDALSIQGDKPTLLPGARGAIVAQAQQILKDKGYYQGRIDGDFGKGTKAAVEAFQSANGLQVDGKVGIKTWQKLDAIATAPVDPAIQIQPLDDISPSIEPLATTTPMVSLFVPSSAPAIASTTVTPELSNTVATSTVANIPDPSPSQPVAISLESAANIYARAQTPQQTAAIDNLQANIPPDILAKFLQRWQVATEQTTPNTSLSSAMRGYNMRQMLNQNLALQWLQSQLMPQVLDQFRMDWSNLSTTSLGISNPTPINLGSAESSQPLINLTQAVGEFRRSPSQVVALETLQRSINPAKMQQFFQRWTVASAQNAIAISMLDVFKDYDIEQHPSQLEALQWLEKELTYGQLSQFSKDWLS
ncbi:MAG: peptidoglycan-binding domain-containing protein [Pseudanabaenaceae cyanobacterium bins.39]|nr:peptidoglycan-binding domain-containing protein [Pseudanabaenaceae cyanobacterium bins.39]